MPTFYRLAQPGSPLIPNDNPDIILDATLTFLEKNNRKEPAVALAKALSAVMNAHRVVLTLEPYRLAQFDLSLKDVDYLDLGFKLPLSAINIGYVLKQFPKEQRLEKFEELIAPTHHYLTILTQELLKENANSLANLYKIDPSGALIFEHMRKYNTIQHEVFVNGMEIAAIVYWNLAPELAKLIRDDSWLHHPYDPTMT